MLRLCHGHTPRQRKSDPLTRTSSANIVPPTPSGDPGSDTDSAPDCFPLCTQLTDASADAMLLFTSLCCTPTSENAVFHLGNPFMLGSNGSGEESVEVRVQSPRKIRNRPPSHSGDFPDYSSVPQTTTSNRVAPARLSFEREDQPFEHNFSAGFIRVAVSRYAASLPKL
jgi:hypothetical protein